MWLAKNIIIVHIHTYHRRYSWHTTSPYWLSQSIRYYTKVFLVDLLLFWRRSTFERYTVDFAVFFCCCVSHSSRGRCGDFHLGKSRECKCECSSKCLRTCILASTSRAQLTPAHICTQEVFGVCVFVLIDAIRRTALHSLFARAFSSIHTHHRVFHFNSGQLTSIIQLARCVCFFPSKSLDAICARFLFSYSVYILFCRSVSIVVWCDGFFCVSTRNSYSNILVHEAWPPQTHICKQ